MWICFIFLFFYNQIGVTTSAVSCFLSGNSGNTVFPSRVRAQLYVSPVTLALLRVLASYVCVCTLRIRASPATLPASTHSQE